jgi:hypothetical protein
MRRRGRRLSGPTRTPERSFETVARRKNIAGEQAAARAARRRAREEGAQQRAAHRAMLRPAGREVTLGEALSAVRRGPLPAGAPALARELYLLVHSRTDPARGARLDALIDCLNRRARKALEPANLQALWAMTEGEWVRPVEGWRRRGKSTDTVLRSLVTHLYARFPLPPFLSACFFSADAAARDHGARLFRFLGAGGSPYKAVKQGLLPGSLTRRMCHDLMQTTGTPTLPEAVRLAQVSALGGDRRLGLALCGSPLGRGFSAREDFWLTAIQWFCAQPMLNPGQIGPLVDYLTYRLGEEPELKMKGRSPLALIRQMEEWHGALQRVRRLRGEVYAPSGLPAGEQIFKRRDDGREVWTVTEILDSKSLAAEGRAMSHCVYSYGRWISAGRSSIWSVQRDGERVLTVEVDNRTRRVVQVRGRFNRSAAAVEASVVSRWAGTAGLTIAAGGW